MKKIVIIVISILLSIFNIAKAQSSEGIRYKLERGVRADLNIPREFLIKPDGQIIVEGGWNDLNLVFNHGTIDFTNNSYNESVFSLQFKSNGKLKGKVKQEGTVSTIVYEAMYCCTNHSPQDCCSLGTPATECGNSTCKF